MLLTVTAGPSGEEGHVWVASQELPTSAGPAAPPAAKLASMFDDPGAKAPSAVPHPLAHVAGLVAGAQGVQGAGLSWVEWSASVDPSEPSDPNLGASVAAAALRGPWLSAVRAAEATEDGADVVLW